MKTRIRLLVRRGILLGGLLLFGGSLSVLSAQVPGPRPGDGADQPGTDDPNFPGIREPVLTFLFGRDRRIEKSIQVLDFNEQVNILGKIARKKGLGRKSLTGHPITRVSNPNNDLDQTLKDLESAATSGNAAAMAPLAREIEDILLGNTQGRIYDGFSLLHFNTGGTLPDQVPGEYKMKRLTDSGETIVSPNGSVHKVWEVTVNMLWYDENFESDTFLLRVPLAASEFDFLRIHFRIYSLMREILTPSSRLNDYGFPGSLGLPFKDFDMIWRNVEKEGVTDALVQFPQLAFLRGVAVWGFHNPATRRSFLHPVFEIVNVHTGQVELDPEGQSLAFRNRGLDLAGIGDAAPEKKMYAVAEAVLAGASPVQVAAMLKDGAVAPAGRWQDWVSLARDPRQLPQEAWDLLAQEGIPQGTFGPYRFVTVFLNNRMYGDGPLGAVLDPFAQSDRFSVRVFNLDAHTHYFQAWDGGPRLFHGFRTCSSAPGGDNSIEIQNRKPVYGVPKEAELQWRAGWGYRPHLDVLAQADTFPRPKDQLFLKPFQDGEGALASGWQFAPDLRGADFVFDPPQDEIGTASQPSSQGLKEADGSPGLVIGTVTPGFGSAKMCTAAAHPLGDFCRDDLSPFHPLGLRNVDVNGDGINDVLWFPPHLRNPDPAGGDLILSSPEWRPFLWISPENGTLFVDPADPAQGFWADRTFAHGAPVPAGGGLVAPIEAPRNAGRTFEFRDGLYEEVGSFVLKRADGL